METEEIADLNDEDLIQLDNDAKVYRDENNTTLEEAKEICRARLDELLRIKRETDDNSIFEGTNKDRLNKCLEKQDYFNSDLKKLKENVKEHNVEKIEKISDSINDLRENNIILSTPVSSFDGEASKEYKLYVDDLQDRIDVVLKNSAIIENIGKIIDEEIITGLEKLEEYNDKREKLRIELNDLKIDYKNYLSTKEEPKVYKQYLDRNVQPNITVNCYVTNVDYIEWLTKKAQLEKDINSYQSLIEDYDKKKEDVYIEINKAMDKELELEKQLKDFSENTTE